MITIYHLTCSASASMLHNSRAHFQLSLVIKESALPVCLQVIHTQFTLTDVQNDESSGMITDMHVRTQHDQFCQHDVHSPQCGWESHSLPHACTNEETRMTSAEKKRPCHVNNRREKT